MILDWRKFVLRSDIKNLPLEEQRRKFLKEQLYYDNLLAEQRQRQYEFYMSQVAGGGPLATGGFSGQAVDGPILGATVISNVGVTTTNALGEFTFKRKPTGPIIVKGGTDSITGLTFEGELIGYAEYKTISPITTIAHYIKEEGSLTIDEAVTKVFASSSALFGIELPIDSKDIVLQRDYIKESIVNNNRVGIAAQAVTTYLEGITETLGESLFSNTQGEIEEVEFSNGKGKNKSYRAIGRQIALDNRLDPSTLTNRIKYNQQDKQGNIIEREGYTVANYTSISSQLISLRNSLRSKVDEQQYTTNYLTTQIQAFNRAQKTTIKQEAFDSQNISFKGFTNIEEAKANVENDLKQIEAGKANETDAVVDSRLTSYGTPEGAFSQKDPKGSKVKFEPGVFGDNTSVRSIVYFGSSLQGSTLYKTVESKLGVGYQTILMRVGVENSVTTASISANEYIEIEVTDENKNPFLITAKPQPLLEKPTAATLTAVSITKGQEQPAVDHISGEGTYTITSGLSNITPSVESNIETGKYELHWVEKAAGQLILREIKGEEGIFEVTNGKTILATKLTFTDDEMSFSIPDEELKEGKRVYNVSYSTESNDNSSDVDHIQNTKSVQYSIAELVDGSYTKETTNGVNRGLSDLKSGLPMLDIQYSSFYFRITENYSTLAGGAGYVGKEIFTVTDISKEGGLGQLVNNATFVKDEGSTTERLTFSFEDAKKVKRTFRITYNVL